MRPRLPVLEVSEIFSRHAVRALLALERLGKPLSLREFSQECGCNEKSGARIRDLLVKEEFVAAPKMPGHGDKGIFQIALTPRGKRMAELLRSANDHALRRPPSHP